MNLNYPNLDYPFGPWLGDMEERAALTCEPPVIVQVNKIKTTSPIGSWKYSTGKGRYHYVPMALFISASLHIVLFYSFNGHHPLKTVAIEPPEQLTLIDLSKLKPDDDEEDITREKPTGDEGAEAPTLPDLPTTVSLADAFVQQIDFASLVPKPELTNKTIIFIPPRVRHGLGNGEGLKDIFNLADLDRIPRAIFQPVPHVSSLLLNDASSSEVVVEFIVSKTGEVVQADVIKEPSTELGEIALKSVLKWKFKPGMKRGRAVNTRISQPIIFHRKKEE